MAYIKWNGLYPHKLIFLSGIVGLVISFILVRLMYDSYDVVRELVGTFVNFELFILLVSAMSFLSALLWWFVASRFVPFIVPIVGKIFFRGNRLYIDKNQIKQKSSIGQFFSRYITLALAVFSLNFLISTTLFETPEDSVSVISFVLTITILTFLVPVEWILQDIGIRALDEENLKISSLADFFGDLVKEYVVTSSVVVSFVSLILTTDLADLPVYLQVSLVRSIFPSMIIVYVFTILLSSAPVFDEWKKRNIVPGETTTVFDE